MKAQLMLTCLCDAFYGEAGIATVQILEHYGVEVVFPKDQTCCGQPAFNSGDWNAARKLTDRVWDVFDQKLPIVVPSASCAAMLRHGAGLMASGERKAESGIWSEDILSASGPRSFTQSKSEPTRTNPSKSEPSGDPAERREGNERSESGPEHGVYELSEFLLDVLQISTWPLRGTANLTKKKIIFHQSCHGRMIGLGDRQKRLLQLVPNLEILEPEFPEQCCGFGGMFAAKQPHLSESIGLQKLSTLWEAGNFEIVSGDMGCLMHLQTLAAAQNERLRVKHYAEILAEAISPSPLLKNLARRS